jgi:hypothetical protein
VKALPGGRPPAEHLDIFADRIAGSCALSEPDPGMNEIIHVAQDDRGALLARLLDINAEACGTTGHR